MKYTKHIHVLQLLSTIPTDVQPTRTASCCNWVYPDGWVEKCNDAFDHILVYIHTNWIAPSAIVDTEFKVNVFDCREMLRMRRDELEDKLASLPPYFSEVIFPIAVARYMLGDLALPIDHRKVTAFREFHNRYGSIILTY